MRAVARPMSGMGQKRTSAGSGRTSALGQERTSSRFRMQVWFGSFSRLGALREPLVAESSHGWSRTRTKAGSHRGLASTWRWTLDNSLGQNSGRLGQIRKVCTLASYCFRYVITLTQLLHVFASSLSASASAVPSTHGNLAGPLPMLSSAARRRANRRAPAGCQDRHPR